MVNNQSLDSGANPKLVGEDVGRFSTTLEPEAAVTCFVTRRTFPQPTSLGEFYLRDEALNRVLLLAVCVLAGVSGVDSFRQEGFSL